VCLGLVLCALGLWEWKSGYAFGRFGGAHLGREPSTYRILTGANLLAGVVLLGSAARSRLGGRKRAADARKSPDGRDGDS